MAFEIRPLHDDDLEELGRFLTEGFHAPREAAFAAPDVLRWRYLEPIGDDASPRSYVACDEGRIVGHVGVCRTTFGGPGLPPEGVSTLHMMDWLGSREHRSVGTSLMRQAHETAATQHVLVANDLARRVTKGAGYSTAAEIPVFHKVLRAGYRRKVPGLSPWGKALRIGKDLVRVATNPGKPPRTAVELRKVSAFGLEVGPIVDANRARAILTARDVDRLAHALRFPRPGMSGWLVLRGDHAVGFALLNVVEQGDVRTGKLVECLVEDQDDDLWHAAVSALTNELRGQGADLAVGFGSTPWTAEALRRSGFAEAHRLEFTLRDRKGLIPRDATYHLSPFEADYAYH